MTTPQHTQTPLPAPTAPTAPATPAPRLPGITRNGRPLTSIPTAAVASTAGAAHPRRPHEGPSVEPRAQRPTPTTPPGHDWTGLAERVLAGTPAGRDDALRILRSHDDDILELMAGAYRIRRRFHGRSVKLNMLINAQSGRCAEDCAYCSQSIYATAPVPEYQLVDEQTIVEGARHAHAQQAGTYCMVMSGRRASRRDVDRIASAARRIREEMPEMKLCACLGLIDDAKAEVLADSGVERFNHNVNTAPRYHDRIVTTHTYRDRVETIESVRRAGISPCSGIICGLGEDDDDLAEAALELRRLEADSVPINFLIPQEGTPLAGRRLLTPLRCLKIVAMFRYLLPGREIRLAGGRELNLGQLQPLALFAANSVFLGDYLTSEGQTMDADRQMIDELGFVVEQDAHAS